MSTTRIVFIAVCIILAVILCTLGVIFQKNDPDSKYSLKHIVNTGTDGSRRKLLKLPKNPSSFLTIFLLIVLLFLFLVFRGR